MTGTETTVGTKPVRGMPGVVDLRLIERADLLRERAEQLRDQADHLDPVLATTYRRRAAELELEAWANEVRSMRPIDEITPVAA
jgi:hypothetical protein